MVIKGVILCLLVLVAVALVSGPAFRRMLLRMLGLNRGR